MTPHRRLWDMWYYIVSCCHSAQSQQLIMLGGRVGGAPFIFLSCTLLNCFTSNRRREVSVPGNASYEHMFLFQGEIRFTAPYLDFTLTSLSVSFNVYCEDGKHGAGTSRVESGMIPRDSRSVSEGKKCQTMISAFARLCRRTLLQNQSQNQKNGTHTTALVT